SSSLLRTGSSASTRSGLGGSSAFDRVEEDEADGMNGPFTSGPENGEAGACSNNRPGPVFPGPPERHGNVRRSPGILESEGPNSPVPDLAEALHRCPGRR